MAKATSCPNLTLRASSAKVSATHILTAALLCAHRYGKIMYWSFSTNRGSGGVTGHFTQMVWWTTRSSSAAARQARLLRVLSREKSGLFFFGNFTAST